MKRCPECRRDYYDDTLLYCLDDGNALLDGPATARASDDEPATAILSEPGAIATGFPASESPIRAQIDTTDQTAIFPDRAEAKPQEDSGELSERRSHSAHQAAKPQGSRAKLFAVAGVTILLLVGGFFAYRYFSSNSKQIESIAVMPFVNESGNADVEYLSDGMTETLISSLSNLPNLNVKPRSSVFRYKGKDTDLPTIAKELNVQAILNGRIVQRGDNLTLYLSLVDAQTGNQIWGEPYNRKMIGLVSLQSEIARDVSQKLKTKLSGADKQRLAKNYTKNPEAFQLYLKGRFYWNKRTPQDLQKAIEYFNQAIAVDPNYALGYAGLADAYALRSNYRAAPPHETMPKAKDAALKALSLDNNLAEAHTALGLILHIYDYDFAGAEREHLRAIELNPNYATAHHFYGIVLSHLGRHEESLAQLERALEIDPFSLVITRAYGERLIFARRYDDAITQLKKTLELDADSELAHFGLAIAYQTKGNYAEAVEEYAKYQEQIGEPQTAAIMRESYSKSGWQGFLRMITEKRIRFNSPLDNLATFYAALGE